MCKWRFRGANEGEEKEDRNMASNGHTALRHGDSCQCVIGLPARVCCEAVRVAKNKLPTADLSAPPSQPEERRGEQNGDLSTWVLWWCHSLAWIWLSYLESIVWARTAFGCFCLCSVHGVWGCESNSVSLGEPHVSSSICSLLDEGGCWVWNSNVCTTQLCFAPLICQEQRMCVCVC